MHCTELHCTALHCTVALYASFCIGASISIGREIRCLPYAGFLRCKLVQCSGVQCSALHSALLFTALPCPALPCTALHCTALHCTALHCTALHCTTKRAYLIFDSPAQEIIWRPTLIKQACCAGCRLRPSPAEASPLGQIQPFSKMAVTFEPLMGFWYTLGFRKLLITMT